MVLLDLWMSIIQVQNYEEKQTAYTVGTFERKRTSTNNSKQVENDVLFSK